VGITRLFTSSTKASGEKLFGAPNSDLPQPRQSIAMDGVDSDVCTSRHVCELESNPCMNNVVGPLELLLSPLQSTYEMDKPDADDCMFFGQS